MAPSAKIADWSRARAAAAAVRVFASRNVDVTTREVLEAAETETSRVSSASPNEATSPNETARDAESAEKKYAEKAEHSNVHALELLRRVAASAVRDASGASGFPRGGPGAWSRRLWGDLAALAGGALAGAVSKEDAAAELVRAQLRCGNGAGSADFARRALAELFGTVRVSERVSERGAPTVTVTTAEAHDAVSNEERKNPAAPQLHGDGEDVNLGAAVRVVAGAAAGELVTAAGDRLRGAAGALGGMVRDARAGARAGGALSGALGGALGGLVGGLGAGIAELHAGSHSSRMGKYADSSADDAEPFSSRLGTHGHGPPPALPARRAASLVAETAAEFLFAATSSFGEDENLRRAEEILACVPEPFAETRRSDGAGTDEPSGEPTSGPTYAESVPALRAFAAATRGLASFGLDLPPCQLRRKGVVFAEPGAAESEASREAKFELLRLCLETSDSASDSASDERKTTILRASDEHAYRRGEDLFQLAAVLGLDDHARLEAMLGRAALGNGDVSAAERAAFAVARAGRADAWAFVSDFVARALDRIDESEEPSSVQTDSVQTPKTFFNATVESTHDSRDASNLHDALSRLRALLAFALARAPAEAKPGLLARWQDLETRRLVALGAGGADAEPFVAKPNQIEPIGVDQDAERQTLSLRTFCSERVAASAASKPRSRLRALAEGTERGLGTFPLLLREMAEIEREGNGEIDADAARAASYALGARGARLWRTRSRPPSRETWRRARSRTASRASRKKKLFRTRSRSCPP